MKTNIKKILIALDYDPTAQKVAEEGYSLAKSMEAEVVLLHVIADPSYYYPREPITIMGFAGYTETDPLKLDRTKGLKMESQQFLNKSKEHLGNEAISTLVKEGDFAETIIKTAKELKIDIIVLGTHSRKWLEEIVMGSVTKKVLQLTSIPIFIIPTKKGK